jgi:hypothetical protein
MADPVGGADSASPAWSGGNDAENMSAGNAGGIGDEQNIEPATVDQSWNTAWSRAVALFLVCLGLAVVILVANWALHNSSDQDSTPARTTATPRPATTTTVVSTPDQDERYIAALKEKGVVFGDNDQGVSSGKAVCQSFAAGQTMQQVTADFRAANQGHPEYTDHAETFVAVSVRTYCPKYNKLVAAY